MISSGDWPAARLSSTTDAIMRVPLMQALPWHTAGSVLIRVRQSIWGVCSPSLGGQAACRRKLRGIDHGVPAMRLYSCNPLIIRTNRGLGLHTGDSSAGQEQLCNDPLHKFPYPDLDRASFRTLPDGRRDPDKSL